MIEIIEKTYYAEMDWLMVTVKFTSGDYQIIFEDRLTGDLTDEQAREKLQPKYEKWIARIS